MRTGTQDPSKLPYAFTLVMLAVALTFPFGLMVFNPTLMFERGWEQYLGTGIYVWAVVTLAGELRRLWANERAFEDAPALLAGLGTPGVGAKPARRGAGPDDRTLPSRVRQLSHYLQEARTPPVAQLMEINREESGLDQEQAAGRFALTKYILYLLPVIGFIGTVEGISKALMNISRVLPMVKDLDGFMGNLTSVTSALQIAFDSTLLALFLSAALMLVQTLVYRRSEDLLARVDRWVVQHVLPKFGADGASGGGAARDDPAAAQLDRLREDLNGLLTRFTASVDRLPESLAGFHRGAELIGRVGGDLEAIGSASESVRRGVATLGRIETAVASTDHLAELQRGVDRNCQAVEALSNSLSQAFDRSNRASQEQLARTMTSLKDALDLLNVSMEQGNALYRTIVKRMFDEQRGGHDGIRVA